MAENNKTKSMGILRRYTLYPYANRYSVLRRLSVWAMWLTLIVVAACLWAYLAYLAGALVVEANARTLAEAKIAAGQSECHRLLADPVVSRIYCRKRF